MLNKVFLLLAFSLGCASLPPVVGAEPELGIAEQHRINGLILFSSGKVKEAEGELRIAAQMDPRNDDTFARLGYIDFVGGRFSQAVDDFSQALLLNDAGTNSAWIHAILGSIFADRGQRGEAVQHLEKASRFCPAQDVETIGNLWNGFAMLNEIGKAVQYGEKYVGAARQQGVSPEKIGDVERYLRDWKPRLAPVYMTNGPPKEYTPTELHEILKGKLSPDELRTVVNPLDSDQEMRHWAIDLVSDQRTGLSRARTLFDVVARRVSNNTLLFEQASCTAKEVFGRWGNTNLLLHCQQATYLLVSLARAVGLKAFVTFVDVSFDGTSSPHVCAAIYDENRMLLADPTYVWFGAPHRKFRVLDDLEAIAIYLSPWKELPAKTVAVRLGPDLPLTHYNLCMELLRLGRLSDAQPELDLLRKMDPGSPYAYSAGAGSAMGKRHFGEARSLLKCGLAQYPADTVLLVQAADVFVELGEWDEAREAYMNALKHPHTKQQEEIIARSLSSIEGHRTGRASTSEK